MIPAIAAWEYRDRWTGAGNLIGIEEIKRQSQPPRRRREFLRGAVVKSLRRAKVFVNGHAALLLWKLLPEIADTAVLDDFACVFAVVLHQTGIVNEPQQRGFAVALFPDNGGFVVFSERKREILDEGAKIAAMCHGKMFDLQDTPRLLFVFYPADCKS